MLLDRIRNIGVVAHIDAGKTTTTERVLYYAGYTSRIGDVDAGSTVMDYLPQERERGITINSAAITFGWRSHRVNLIDTPGHVDFTFEVERALRVLDGAVTILDAVAGVEAQTETVWRQANRYSIPRVAFVNKMDREGANMPRTVDMMRRQLHGCGVPIVCQLPVFGHNGRGHADADRTRNMVTATGTLFDGVIDLVSMELVHWKDDAIGSVVQRIALPPDSAFHEQAATARTALVETLGEHDDQLLDKYLDCGDALDVPAGDIRAALRRATIKCAAVPVLCGASFRNMGVQPLLDAVIDYLPSPAERPPPRSHRTDGISSSSSSGSLSKRAPSTVALTDRSLCALAFKVVHDQKRGLLVYVRVYSGSLAVRSVVQNTVSKCKERVNKIMTMYADKTEEIASLSAGDIGVLVGLKDTRTGDTLVSSSDASMRDVVLQALPIPPPVFMCAVEPASPSDEKPLEAALHSLVREDPSVHISQDPETGQTLIGGMGELHMEITRDRLLNIYKVNASLGKMRIAYKETVVGLPPTLEYSVMYDREIAGKRARCGLSMTVSPLTSAQDHDDPSIIRVLDDLAETAGNDIVVDVAANGEEDNTLSLERSTIASSAVASLSHGPLLHFGVTNLSVRLHSLQTFPETTPAVLASATHQLFKVFFQSLNGHESAQSRLLEPVMDVEVVVPFEHVGSVMQDISGKRRGRIVGLSGDEQNAAAADMDAGRQSIKCVVPLSELVGYSSVLRSLTGGAGAFSMKLVGYSVVGAEEMQSVMRDIRGY
ncbi:Ribosome-releasing factor 2, mitochondrial [Sorochytrium milnesiophthora]